MKKTVIRMLALTMALVLCLGLAACGAAPDEGQTKKTKKTTTTTEEVADATTTDKADTTVVGVNTTTTTTKKNDTTTTSRTKNVQGGIAHTTEAPTTTTTRPQPKNPIRVLAIGHSFAVDALRAHLWDMLKCAGYDYIVVAYLFTPSCSLNEQWERMQGKADHEQYCKTDPYTGEWDYYGPVQGSPDNKVQYAIRDEKWDVITLQPDPDYGGGLKYWPSVDNDYKNLGNILNWIYKNKTNSKAKLYYHMTWSFAKDCALWCFGNSSPFKGDQLLHYRSFVEATREYVLKPYNSYFAGVIPAGTSIQNARSSRLGDTFNMPGNNDPKADGYHLNDKGDYVASLTWYAVITGKSAKTVTYYGKNGEYKADFAILAEAVDNAVAKWDDVTPSSYK